MRKQQHISLSIFAVLATLMALALTVSAQTTPGWSTHGPNLATTSLAIDPVNAGTIYAGTSDGVFKSTDDGESWHRTSLGGDIVALAIDYARPNVLYAAIAERSYCVHTDQRMFKSIDGGTSWSALSSRINGCDNIHSLVISPSNPDIVYVANYDDLTGDTPFPLIRSVDDGATWSEFSTWREPGVPPFAALAIDPRNPNVVYAGGYEMGVFITTNGGAHWSATGPGNTGVTALAIDPVNPKIVFAATGRLSGYPRNPSGFQGLFKSIDGGASWLPANNGLSDLLNADLAVTAILIDHDNPNIVYAGTAGSGVFKTIDGGTNWSSLNDGLTSLDVQGLMKAPGTSHILYAATSGGVFKISDSIAPPEINQIDDAEVFVRQQYRDFLNREPDAAGLAFWTDNISKCRDTSRRPAAQTEAECVDKQRETTSAAFFLSPEFQYTGYFVYRLYKGALLQNGAGRFPTYQEFLRDVRQVASGIIQNNQLSASVIEENKKSFAEEFTRRAEFRSLYDPLSNLGYVERLFQTTGIDVSGEEKQALVEGLDQQTETRASVLQKVTDGVVVIAEGNQQFTTSYGQGFYEKEFSAAFVLMEYFGYLKRDPDAAGYQHWLDKLNFYGNYLDAEMVRSFIVSPEYRARFGQP
jgi:photosystem II stability/assembly factor-like uncharacterized protein